MGWKYKCLCSEPIIQDLDVGMWISAIAQYQPFQYEDEWMLSQVSIQETPDSKSKIHRYLNLARHFLCYEQSIQNLFQHKDLHTTHEFVHSFHEFPKNIDQHKDIWKGLLVSYTRDGYAPILIQTTRQNDLFAQWSISPKYYQILDPECIVILEEFIKNENIDILLRNIRPFLSLDSAKKLRRAGIFADFMYFVPPIQGYRNVLVDFEELLQKSKQELLSSSFGMFFRGTPPKKSEKPNFVLPMNTDQYRAISHATCQKWTTITGPPGTGKTQVLINILISCLLNEERICIVAKNNQALDVIFGRVLEIHPNALAMRTGSSVIRDELIDILDGIFSIPPKPPKEDTEIFVSHSEIQTRDLQQQKIPFDSEWLQQYKTSLQEKIREVGLPLLEDHQVLLQLLEEKRIDDIQHILQKQSIIWSNGVLEKNIFGDYRKSRYLKLYRKVVAIERLQEKRIAENERRTAIQEAWIELCHHRMSYFWDQIRYHSSSKGRVVLSRYQKALKEKKGHLEIFPELLDILPLWGVTTLSARSTFPLIRELFDVVIVDEASQADIPSFLPMLYRSKRVVVIGDPNQLPPIISMSEDSEQKLHAQLDLQLPSELYFSTKNSLFSISEYLSHSLFLAQHYRCPPKIASLVSRLFYDNKLQPQRKDDDPTSLLWISIEGKPESGEQGSLCNLKEAHCIVEIIVQKILQSEWTDLSIGVLSPYRGQVHLIQQLLQQKCPHVPIQVDTAHRFQGDEKDVILMSLVITPSSSAQQFDFVMDRQLINVALTRAKQKLWIFSHPKNPTKNPLLKEIFDACILHEPPIVRTIR